MAANLHARRKTHLDEEWTDRLLIDAPFSGGSLKGKRGRRKGLSGEPLLYALVAVVAFLALGLLLTYSLLQHQHRKVILHIMKDPWAHGKAILRGRAGFRHHFYSGSPRFVTIVLPSIVNPSARQQRLEAIQDTWGPYARAIYVVHNVSEFPDGAHAVISDTSSPEDPYSFPQLLLVPPEIDVSAGLPRLYHTLRTVYDKVNPDFTFFVNDHTFVIPEHLCSFLALRHPDDDLYAGHALRSGDKDVFNSGAAGYILSRSALRKMMERNEGKDPNCNVEEAGNWIQTNPGLSTLQCLNSLGIRAMDTRATGKWHRFHTFPLTRTVSGNVDQWYHNKHTGMRAFPAFDESYEKLLPGEDCCAKTTISFHYVEAMEAHALFGVRDTLLKHPHLTDHELKALLNAEWPKKRSDLGIYSHGLPPSDDEDQWKQLLAVLRKISTRETQVDC